mmetsp:Transcript_6927/g.11463  ORF Transcript_6927/g.11463 Transcript_6927/m.11463 type:complete len:256 (+) Transcript_6927:179-946(+)|eukprot:CAMPEP_0119015342 /NCGR_PEP_ID=MMETSP1176-20130426/10848_1 /TAXON_ID=265551 /ORGANISM="Synedropsis recta cf, Strain CCMP1620" /LENGTH=255 /DNA_ID=CAMNT_0006968629 /DNA_START=179 /DNA_END=946 /DNA_ORIENTATION=+
MKKTFIFLTTAIYVLGGASAFSPIAPHATNRQALSSPLFRPISVRTVPLFAEESSSSSSDDVPKKMGIKSSKSIFRKIDDYGVALKPKAMEAKEKISTMTKPAKKFRYRLQSYALFSLFILYRSYRGFFVILPAIFREVYKKMEKTVESPFKDDDYILNDLGEKKDVNPKTGKLRLRTTLTVSVLTGIVTLSYIVSGALRVLGRFVRTATRTSSASTSFLAAADEMESNEDKMMQLTNKNNNMVNGSKTTTDGFA